MTSCYDQLAPFTAVKRLGTCVNTRVIYALPVTKFPRSISATRAISVLSSIILPLQTFFSRVLLLRQQPFSSENLPPERPTTTIAIKTQVYMFRYEHVNSTRKLTIVAEIVSLLKKIYKRDAPLRAVFVYVIAWALGKLRTNFTSIFKVFTKLPESRSDEGNLENFENTSEINP